MNKDDAGKLRYFRCDICHRAKVIGHAVGIMDQVYEQGGRSIVAEPLPSNRLICEHCKNPGKEERGMSTDYNNEAKED